jgi:hypothetical protein
MPGKSKTFLQVLGLAGLLMLPQFAAAQHLKPIPHPIGQPQKAPVQAQAHAQILGASSTAPVSP